MNEQLKLPTLGNDIDRNLSAQIDYFDKIGNKQVSDAFRSIKNEKDTLFGGVKTGLLDQFDAFQNLLNPSFNQFINQSQRIAGEILPGIQQQYKTVQEQFGPNGALTNQATAYYKNLSDAVNSAVSGNVASVGNQAINSGASQSAINQAINQARSQGLGDLAKIQAEELAQKQQLYNNLFSLQDNLRQQNFNYNNELIRNPILQLNQMLSGLGSQVLTGLQGYDVAQLNNQLQQQAQAQALAAQQAAARATPRRSNGTDLNALLAAAAAAQTAQQTQQTNSTPASINNISDISKLNSQQLNEYYNLSPKLR